jgi:hypothetical protein
MPDPKLDLVLHRRPARVLVGFLAGLLFGPVFALVLALAPSSRWLGPRACYDAGPMAVMIGGCCGPAVGLAVALFALALQRWKWGRERPHSIRWCPEPERSPDQQSRGGNGEERVLPETSITRSTDSTQQGPASAWACSWVKPDKPG